MKRQKRKATPKKKPAPTAAAQSAPFAPTRTAHQKARGRRDFMQNLGYGAAGLAAVVGGGWYFAGTVSAGIAEGDFSRLGNGIPTVVQIHDPQCPRCRALQKETRAALSQLDDGQIQYLVANIRQAEGRELAAAHGVGHVTLLLFDGEGNRRGVLAGERSSDLLLVEFKRLIAGGKSS